MAITWWGNIRFEPAFTPDLCRLLAASGCIAVSAGLEAASDRLLEEMKKGITVSNTARVSAAFRGAGILVHAYLMYGLPGETIAETIESHERVRQLFAHGLIQSAFWHKFTATAHSPIGLHPADHGIRITGPVFGGFADNDLTHEDPRVEAPGWLGAGLRKALGHYLEGEELATDVRSWFDCPVKQPQVPRNWVTKALAGVSHEDDPTIERRIVWIGGTPVIENRRREHCRVILPGRAEDAQLRLPRDSAAWLIDLVQKATPMRDKRENYPRLQDVRDNFFLGPPAFGTFLRSAAWKKARAVGLLLV